MSESWPDSDSGEANSHNFRQRGRLYHKSRHTALIFYFALFLFAAVSFTPLSFDLVVSVTPLSFDSAVSITPLSHGTKLNIKIDFY